MAPQERVLATASPVHLGRTLGPLRRGAGDLSLRLNDHEMWRATRGPSGPATIHVHVDPGAGEVRGRAWGPGAEWVLEHLGDLVGLDDDDSPLLAMLRRSPPSPGQSLLRDLHRRLPGLRLPKTRAVTETLVPIVIEQKVVGSEARRSYRDLVAALGEPAPGAAAGLMVPPAPAVLAATPAWAFHRFNIEAKRAEAVRAISARAPRLEALAEVAPAVAQQRLGVIAGIGPWSAAELALAALADPDAVSVGDYHLPHQLAWAFTGTPRGDDARMLELLEPYRGQRGRVIRLVVAAGITPPRFGPRRPRHSFRTY